MTWLRGRAAVSGAASIACLIGPCRPSEAISQAKHRFKSISADKVGVSTFADNNPDVTHGSFAQPCILGQCDVFLSHSWHDDGMAKWRALQNWRAAFVAE